MVREPMVREPMVRELVVVMKSDSRGPHRCCDRMSLMGTSRCSNDVT